MSAITYTANARASLISGHVAGTDYTFEIKARAHDRGRNIRSSQVSALSGTLETTLEGIDGVLSLTLGSVADGAEMDQVYEWFDSVAGGEIFLFDLNGTASQQDNPIALILTSNKLSERRVGVNNFIFSIQCRRT